MLALLFTAAALGLIFNAAPGAVFAETVRVGVHGGFRSALAVQVGSLVGDASWAILGLAGVGLLLQAQALQLPIGLAGTAYLLWLSWDSWTAANQEFLVDHNNAAVDARKALRAGVLLSLTNPQNVAYWAALGSAMGAVGVADPTLTDYALFFAGFMASSLLWCVVCAGIVDRIFRNAGQRWARMTYRLCALAFLLLALSSIKHLLGLPAPTVNSQISQQLDQQDQ
ncbi:LysE family transporter [Pseudomonas neustonica]|uniref:Chemotaxis protein n=1 Tax=Pseudomonas neustonica TaxID=2487346 RepID=A0ABX9XJP4_9PSED|nr:MULTISPECIES: LysE family transporter [Pseudomonas]ROZ82247.1 chemotaxis protein [Pseudomonas sp. SSM44]ROZ84021.1 chemotaxis protein [Pseudomonas neustonica]|tara:strand:+ start:873 stop:1550 length:678 start_codon:yes stop_codon:yes gene_type:complete